MYPILKLELRCLLLETGVKMHNIGTGVKVHNNGTGVKVHNIGTILGTSISVPIL